MVTSAPANSSLFEQQGNGDDFVRLLVHSLLTQDEALAGRPCGNQMHRLTALGPRVAPPGGLAVYGNEVRSRFAQRADPIGEKRLEEFGVEGVDHVVERIMGRQPAVEGQETSKKINPLLAPEPDLDKILHARQRRT
jgi:hypothetical protein